MLYIFANENYAQLFFVVEKFSTPEEAFLLRPNYACNFQPHYTFTASGMRETWSKYVGFCLTINPIVSMNDLCGPRNEVTYICCLEFVLSLNVVYFANPTTKELFDFSFNANTLSSYEISVNKTYIDSR